MPITDLQLPFGAVYFRKSNPPRADWERDYAVAAEDGLNVFRHWFMWGSIERRPGVYDFDDYDRQLDLAARHGIRTVIASMIHSVPDWAVRRWSHARQMRADGRVLGSHMGVSAATGGFSENGMGAGTLSLDCPEVRDAAGAFIRAMAARYRGHPGLWAYDVWNECNYAADVDYSPFAKAAFREWLRAKYGTVEALAPVWHRYSYAEWDDVEPPTQMAPYPECLDWLRFRREHAYDDMQWHIDQIRGQDADVAVVAHGVSGAVPNLAANGCDDWAAASKVDAYGFTWIQARKGAEAWKNWYGVDINRAAARGKPFWHAERQGGPLWLQPQVIGRDKEDGRMAEPEDIRLWSLTSLAGGARGVVNLRWRPLLDGPLFGAFGAYGMDGARTPRSAMQSRLAKWGNKPDLAGLWAAKPVQGEVGILFVPDTQEWDYTLMFSRAEKPYPAAMWGAFRGWLEQGVQPDWVHIDDMDGYDLLYFPYPIMFTAAQAARIRAWVEAGGTLICESCPGYFGDMGHVGPFQPNHGLDTLFGAREEEVEWMPDIGNRYGFSFDAAAVDGAGILQSYLPAGGTVRGRFADGRVAVVEHRAGSGRTLLVGSNPSVAHYTPTDKGRTGTGNGAFFAALWRWAGKARHVELSNPALQARLHVGEAGSFLWLVNPTREEQRTRATVAGRAASGRVLWPEDRGSAGGELLVGARDVAVLHLDGA